MPFDQRSPGRITDAPVTIRFKVGIPAPSRSCTDFHCAAAHRGSRSGKPEAHGAAGFGAQKLPGARIERAAKLVECFRADRGIDSASVGTGRRTIGWLALAGQRFWAGRIRQPAVIVSPTRASATAFDRGPDKVAPPHRHAGSSTWRCLGAIHPPPRRVRSWFLLAHQQSTFVALRGDPAH